ncbi:MAG: bifunctional riboflavin kinase/FAD synthetase [Gemmatimonadaceae bacterium]|nr:bifunctional riboflavin kinase/FAD synthetase [Gemmatimonadaceae bacterium]MCW5825063.1 bifunctional riboflavin kinase/FAD synthetase [Gemmatimonadaceae bacterium]
MRPDPAFGLPPSLRGTVCTVGTFDGVHRGHQLVLERLAARARAHGLPAVLVTFEPHPLEVVNPAAAPPLLTLGSEKSEVLAESPIDYVVVLPFTPTLARYEAADFVDHVLIEHLGVRELLIGYDHGFGRARSGDADVLRSLGASRGFDVAVVEAVQGSDGRPISSTTIRRAIAGGDLARAADGLGRAYSIGGVVRQGDQRGRTIGFPTLNLGAPSPRKLLPPEGVYAVRVQTPRGTFGGMMNLGPRPTFGDPISALEVHCFEMNGELYGSRVRVDLLARLRETQKFDGPDALRAQLAKDESQARAVLATVAENGPPPAA